MEGELPGNSQGQAKWEKTDQVFWVEAAGRPVKQGGAVG
jgi:hypothetical protein